MSEDLQEKENSEEVDSEKDDSATNSDEQSNCAISEYEQTTKIRHECHKPGYKEVSAIKEKPRVVKERQLIMKVTEVGPKSKETTELKRQPNEKPQKFILDTRSTISIVP